MADCFLFGHTRSVESTLRNMRASQMGQIHLALSLRHRSMRFMGPSRGKISVRGFTVHLWHLLRSEPSHPMVIMGFKAPPQPVLDQGPQVTL